MHQETTFDHDTVRRHITVLALTTSRLVIAHADDHAGDHDEPTAEASVRHGHHRERAAVSSCAASCSPTS